MSNVIHIKTQEFNELIANHELVLIDFYATWCAPCKMLGPQIEKLADEHPEAKIVKVDVDQEPSLAEQFSVQTIPTLIAFKNGQAVQREVGFVSFEQLENMLK